MKSISTTGAYRLFSYRMGTPRLGCASENGKIDLDLTRGSGANQRYGNYKTPLGYEGLKNCWSLQPFFIGNFLLNQSFQWRNKNLQYMTSDQRFLYVQQKGTFWVTPFEQGEFSKIFSISWRKKATLDLFTLT